MDDASVISRWQLLQALEHFEQIIVNCVILITIVVVDIMLQQGRVATT